MSQKSAYHAQLRAEHTPTIKAFCDDLGLKYEFIHGFEWHIRIENIMDVFPTRNRYHLLKTDERGGFSDYEELGRIFETYVNKEELSW
jgi:hypothetical protein